MNTLDLKEYFVKIVEMFQLGEQLTFSPGSNYPYLSGNCIVRKSGRMIHLYIGSLTGLPKNENVTLFSLPVGYRPANTMNCDMVTMSSSQLCCVRLTIAPDGNVSAYNYSENTGILNTRGSITYIVSSFSVLGGVINYLIHLTGLFKSSERRWAYAELQKGADKDNGVDGLPGYGASHHSSGNYDRCISKLHRQGNHHPFHSQRIPAGAGGLSSYRLIRRVLLPMRSKSYNVCGDHPAAKHGKLIRHHIADADRFVREAAVAPAPERGVVAC